MYGGVLIVTASMRFTRLVFSRGCKNFVLLSTTASADLFYASIVCSIQVVHESRKLRCL